MDKGFRACPRLPVLQHCSNEPDLLRRGAIQSLTRPYIVGQQEPGEVRAGLRTVLTASPLNRGKVMVLIYLVDEA